MASDVQELTAKSTGKLLKKREITLVDSSGAAVCIYYNNLFVSMEKTRHTSVRVT